MIGPMIHQMLRRDDLWRLVAEISRVDAAAARPAARALEEGRVDGLLDSPMALEAVRGQGGPPAPLPLTLLWYVPVRAALSKRGIPDIDLADFTATLAVLFSAVSVSRRVARGERALSAWSNSIDALPPGTVGRGERAAECGALALWWAGCFPEAVQRRGGRGMVRAYVTFASSAFELAARTVAQRVPDTSAMYHRAAARTEDLCGALSEARADYLGPDAADPARRLARFLERFLDKGDVRH